jgi:hypothetical protein
VGWLPASVRDSRWNDQDHPVARRSLARRNIRPATRNLIAAEPETCLIPDTTAGGATR